MKRLALTGGFATGKSTVARMFMEAGIPWINADELVHQLMAPGTTVWEEIVEAFGQSILKADRTIARDRLGDIIFADPQKQARLEAIIHPRVRQQILEKVRRLEAAGEKAVLLEIPLLFEAGWDQEEKWDAIIVVTCDAKTQAKRARQKFGFNEKEIRARLNAQLPMQAKVKRADFVIDNNGTHEETKKQVHGVKSQVDKN
ncbi:MAG: dephospho-CoA kinase [Deltaproteobacteria bacterium]|nr:dephospho-CoA kinase [Deltaproteobacteria bacterium]